MPQRAGDPGHHGATRVTGDRGLGVVACTRQPEIREDPVNDRGVVDGGDQLHPAGAARTAQDVQVEGPGIDISRRQAIQLRP